MKESLKIIAVGNPGSGKSTILNSLAGEVLFKAGVNIGQGLTFKLDEAENKNGHFLDTPGLADEELRLAAGKAISDGLRKGGTFKVLFFVTQETGRVNQQDATTLRLVLEAAPEIGMDYGIIVNKVSQGVLKKLIGRKNDFINTLFAGIPQDKRCVYSNIFFLEKKRELEDEEDQFLAPEEFKNDTGISLLDFVYDKVPDVQITMENVADIKTDQFEELQKELQTMARKLQEKDEEWKEERLKFEEQRVKDAETNKKMLENIKDVHKKEMDQLRDDNWKDERHEFEQRIIDGKEGFSDNGFPIQVIRALKRQLPVPICIKSTTSLDSAMYEPIGERDTELLVPNGQVAVSEENVSSKSEKALHPIPSSLIQMNDRDKIELESVLFDHALRSVGLDFGFVKKAEKEAMQQAEKEASSESIEENLTTKSENHQHLIQPRLTQNHHLNYRDKILLESEERRRKINEGHLRSVGLIQNSQVAISEENVSTKSEKEQHPIPSSLIQMNDEDKIELESILLDDALRSCGLDGFFKKAEKEASSDSSEEKLTTKSEKHWHPIPRRLTQNH